MTARERRLFVAAVTILAVMQLLVEPARGATPLPPLPNATTLIRATFNASLSLDAFVLMQGPDVQQLQVVNGTQLDFAFVGVDAAMNLGAFRALDAASLLDWYGITGYALLPLPTEPTSMAPTRAPGPPAEIVCVANGTLSSSLFIRIVPDPRKHVSVTLRLVPQSSLIRAITDAIGADTGRITVYSYAPYDDPRIVDGTLQTTQYIILSFDFTDAATSTDLSSSQLIQACVRNWPAIEYNLNRVFATMGVDSRAFQLDCLTPGVTIDRLDAIVEDAASQFRAQRLKYMAALIVAAIITIACLIAGWIWTEKCDAAYRETPAFKALSAAVNGHAMVATASNIFEFGSPTSPSPGGDNSSMASPSSPAVANDSINVSAIPASAYAASPRVRRAISFHSSTKEL